MQHVSHRASDQIAMLAGQLEQAHRANARLVAEIERLRAAAVGANVGAGWQPIETAPKDGTQVLLWGLLFGEISGEFERAQMVVGSWLYNCWYADATDAYSVEVRATHWAPLLAPPVGADVGAGETSPEKTADTANT